MVFTHAYHLTSKFSPAVQAVIEIAKQTLHHYYSLTDASEVYRIAMGLLFCECLVAPPAHFFCQCFTLIINSHTAKWPVRHLTGLTLQKTFFTTNSNSHTHCNKLAIMLWSQIGQLTWPFLLLCLQYVPFISATSLSQFATDSSFKK